MESKIPIGTRVRYINPDEDPYNNYYYPPVGTLGTVVRCDEDGPEVKWDSGTKVDVIWWCDFNDIEVVSETMYDRIKRMDPDEMRQFIHWVYLNGNEDGKTLACDDSPCSYFGGAMLNMDTKEVMPNDKVDDLWDNFDETYGKDKANERQNH